MGMKLYEIEQPLISKVQSNAKASDFGKNFKSYYDKLRESQEIETDFKESLARKTQLAVANKADSEQSENKTKTVNFSPIIFEQRTFPIDRVVSNKLPPELDQMNKLFVEYFTEKHQKAKLTLLSDVSIVESKLRIPKNGKTPMRIYTVSSDIVCASILRCVSSAKEKSLRDIYDEVGEDKARIGLYIKRLCQKSCPILERKSKAENKLQEDDTFCLNPNFLFKSLKVTVQPVSDQREKDDIKNKKEAEMDKNTSIKAAIVRCLKARNRVQLVVLLFK